MYSRQNEFSLPPRTGRPWWRRLLRWAVVTFLIITAGILVRHYWNLHQAQRELDEVVAHPDQRRLPPLPLPKDDPWPEP